MSSSNNAEVAWSKQQNDNEIINKKDQTNTIELNDDMDELGGPAEMSREQSVKDRIHGHYKRLRGISKLTLLVWLSRLIPGGAAFACVVYLLVLISSPAVWATNDDATDAERLSRTADRGLFVSIVIAILLNCIGAGMFYIKVREALVVTNYGFILGPVIGFMLDQGIGTDEGWESFGTAKGFDYTFSSLIGGDFMRYIVTVFLDLFISNPLQDILKSQVVKIGVIDALKKMDGKNKWHAYYDSFVAMNYPSILQSIVAFVTFNAYTNQTRFAWAYPGTELSRELRIPPGTIMLSAAIAGVLYLNFYTIMDYINERSYYDVNTKLMYVLAILGLLYGLNATDSIEAPVETIDADTGEYVVEDVVWTQGLEDAGIKWFLGLLLFVCFVLYGFAYPIWTRMGCCGKWKPEDLGLEETVDHIAITEQKVSDAELKTLNVTQQMLDRLKNEILHEFMQEQRNMNANNNKSNSGIQTAHSFNTNKLHSKKHGK